MASVQVTGGLAAGADSVRYGGFWRRFLAFIIDWIVVSASVAILFLVLASIFPSVGDNFILQTPLGLWTTEKTIETKTVDTQENGKTVKTTDTIIEETVLGKWTYYFHVNEVKRETSTSGSTTWSTSKTTRERIDPVTHQEIRGTGLDKIILVGLLIYWIAMETSHYQASFGKLAIGMKVVDGAGNRLSIPKSTGRNLLKFLSAIILFIGFMMAGWTRRKQALHDKIVNCLVVMRD